MTKESCSVCRVRPGQAGVTKLLVCSKCGVQKYCSKECQRTAWSIHKPNCLSISEKKTLKQVKKETTVKACSFCSKTSRSTGEELKSCGVCREVYYCSHECQQQDWNQHKGICTSDPQVQKKRRQQSSTQKEILSLTIKQIRCAKNGDRVGEGRACRDLGYAYGCLGQFTKAIKFQKMDLNIALELDDPQNEAVAYGNLGITYE